MTVITGSELTRSMSKSALDVLETCRSRVLGSQSAALLWNRVLSDQERDRLGGDFGELFRKFGTAGMWQKLRAVSASRAIVDVALQLGHVTAQNHEWLLRELGENSNDVEAAIDLALRTGDLVIVERPRAAFWESKQISIDWEERNALWDFLSTLVDQARRGHPIDDHHLGQNAAPGAATKQKSRLINEAGFPASLAFRIESAGRGTHKLDLPASRIHVFEFIVVETLQKKSG
ncbi:MAG: hypothetical protein WD894_00320 [Pirellulales bacterium]